jgi:hypothetical protein
VTYLLTSPPHPKSTIKKAQMTAQKALKAPREIKNLSYLEVKVKVNVEVEI